MATTTMRASLAFTATLTLNETEMRALDALVGYGDAAFLEVFKAKLGAAYIRDHEAGLKSAFTAIRRDIIPALRDVDTARRDLSDALKKRRGATAEVV